MDEQTDLDAEDEQIDLDAEPEEHKFLVAAMCESPDGDATKEYGFVDADSPTAAATIARSVWSDYDKTPTDAIYVADFTESFDVSKIETGDESE